MPISDEQLLAEADAVICRQEARVDSLVSRATALTGFLAVAAGLAVNELDADAWRAALVAGYGVAAAFGLVVMFGLRLAHRPYADALAELHGANPSVRLRLLLGAKMDSASVNAARLGPLEWFWRAHVVAVASAVAVTCAHVAVRSL